jgi:hypothetical protein
MKRAFVHSLLAGVLAGIAAVGYNFAYRAALLTDFSKVLAWPALLGASIFGCILAGVGHHLLYRKWGRKVDLPFNILFLALSFISFLGPLTATLPLDVASPELFVGATIPMHLFPALFWLALKPGFAPADAT